VIGYASRTGTRRNLRALYLAGWRQLLAPGQHPTHTHGWMLDNGAWSAFQSGQSFDGPAFIRHVTLHGRYADAVVTPDIVAGGLASLELSLWWIPKLYWACVLQLLPVQDGMEPHHVAPHLESMGRRWSRPHQRHVAPVGIFVGGSTEWKEATLGVWGELARRYECLLHVGRVNSARRIQLCKDAGVDSFDGTSATRFNSTLPLLDGARRQESLLLPRVSSCAFLQESA